MNNLQLLINIASSDLTINAFYDFFTKEYHDINLDIVDDSNYYFVLNSILDFGNDFILSNSESIPSLFNQSFNPWIYVAGYSSSKHMFWNNNLDSLNEELVCVFFITYGFRKGFLRNFLGPVCTIQIAKKILYNIIKICIVANSDFNPDIKKIINSFDIICRCNRADNFIPNSDKIDYLIYRQVVFDQSPKLKNKVKSAINHAKIVIEIDGSLNSPSSRLKTSLSSSQVYYPVYTTKLCPDYSCKKKKNHTKKPSTGFIALKMLLSIYPLANIHMFGFSFKGVYLHNWKFEHSFCINNPRISLH